MKAKQNRIQIWLLCAAVLQAVTSGAQPVTKVAAGLGHSLFLKSDGSLWAMGDNRYGQLGDGTYSIIAPSMEPTSPSRLWPAASRRLPPEPSTACFSRATAACGPWAGTSMASWATALINNTNRPEQIVASNVTAIAAGGSHSLFLKSDGSLWAMGYNYYGQLGDGTYSTSPIRNQPPRADCGQQRHGDCRRSIPQPVSQERRQSVGHGRQRVWPVGRRHLSTAPTAPSRLWPATSRRLPPETATACFSRATAVCGPWATTSMASWATALTTSTNRPEQIVASNVTAIAAGGLPQPVSQERRQSVGHGRQRRMASWATALTTTPTAPSRLWPAVSRRLPITGRSRCPSPTKQGTPAAPPTARGRRNRHRRRRPSGGGARRPPASASGRPAPEPQGDAQPPTEPSATPPAIPRRLRTPPGGGRP